MSSDLDIILLCYNPAEEWYRGVANAVAVIEKRLGLCPHVILVNDGSETDIKRGVEYLRKHLSSLDYIEMPHSKGKGAALRMGMQRSTASRVLFTDIDFPYTIVSFLDNYKHLQNHAVAIGIRNKSYYDTIPRRRRSSLSIPTKRKNLNICTSLT